MIRPSLFPNPSFSQSSYFLAPFLSPALSHHHPFFPLSFHLNYKNVLPSLPPFLILSLSTFLPVSLSPSLPPSLFSPSLPPFLPLSLSPYLSFTLSPSFSSLSLSSSTIYQSEDEKGYFKKRPLSHGLAYDAAPRYTPSVSSMQ